VRVCTKCVVLSAAVFQAERRISRGAQPIRARSLGPLVKARAFGMTPEEWLRAGMKRSPKSERVHAFAVDVDRKFSRFVVNAIISGMVTNS
jgi:hypothetical protein